MFGNRQAPEIFKIMIQVEVLRKINQGEFLKFLPMTLMRLLLYMKFAAIGAFLDLILFMFLHALIGNQIASAVGTVVGSLVNYFGNSTFTFRQEIRMETAVRFLFLVSAIAALGSWLTDFMVIILNSALNGKLGSMGVLMMIQFILHNKWTFKVRMSETSPILEKDHEVD